MYEWSGISQGVHSGHSNDFFHETRTNLERFFVPLVLSERSSGVLAGCACRPPYSRKHVASGLWHDRAPRFVRPARLCAGVGLVHCCRNRGYCNWRSEYVSIVHSFVVLTHPSSRSRAVYRALAQLIQLQQSVGIRTMRWGCIAREGMCFLCSL